MGLVSGRDSGLGTGLRAKGANSGLGSRLVSGFGSRLVSSFGSRWGSGLG